MMGGGGGNKSRVSTFIMCYPKVTEKEVQNKTKRNEDRESKKWSQSRSGIEFEISVAKEIVTGEHAF